MKYSPDNVYVWALIGLRALSEYDAYEFRRATDMSKRQIDKLIEDVLGKHPDHECKILFEKIKSIATSVETPMEYEYLLKQVYAASNLNAQHKALLSANEEHEAAEDAERSEQGRISEYRGVSGDSGKVLSNELELVRLSVMRILRELRDYRPEFSRYLGETEVDCVLVPDGFRGRQIIVQGKRRGDLSKTISPLKQIVKIHGALGVVVTDQSRPRHEQNDESGEQVKILSFDLRRNAFRGNQLREFVDWVETNVS